MLSRRQALKALCAAAVATIAPIPALGIAEVPTIEAESAWGDCGCDSFSPDRIVVTFSGLGCGGDGDGTAILYNVSPPEKPPVFKGTLACGTSITYAPSGNLSLC